MSRLLAVSLLALSIAPASAQLENVGNMSFPTSGSPAAQQHFLRGVAILHSFGWKQAIAEFKQAQKAQPDFAMAYWGETLCYNHPLKPSRMRKNPRAVLARLGATPRRAWPRRRPIARRASCRRSRSCGASGDWRAAPRRLHERHGALCTAVPHRRRGQDVLCAVAAERRARAGRQHVPLRDEGRRAGDGRVQAQSEPSGRDALHHPRVRRPDSCAAGARRRARLRGDRPGGVARRPHADAHLHPARDVERGGAIRTCARSTSRRISVGSPAIVARATWRTRATGGSTASCSSATTPARASGSRRSKRWLEHDQASARGRRASRWSRARYIIETEEWKVQPVADDASNGDDPRQRHERRAEGRHGRGRADAREAGGEGRRARDGRAGRRRMPITAAPGPAPAPGGVTDAARRRASCTTSWRR